MAYTPPMQRATMLWYSMLFFSALLFMYLWNVIKFFTEVMRFTHGTMNVFWFLIVRFTVMILYLIQCSILAYSASETHNIFFYVLFCSMRCFKKVSFTLSGHALCSTNKYCSVLFCPIMTFYLIVGNFVLCAH